MQTHQANRSTQKKMFPLIRNKLKRRSKYTSCWPLLTDAKKTPNINPQEYSPLFNKLHLELRLQVYRELLVDRSVFTHIIHLKRGTGPIVYRRCFEYDSPYPTWQHMCYLDWEPSGHSLTAILKTCRRAYAEALHLVHAENTFHFKGALGFLRFASVIPTPQWSIIRRLHISTVFENATIDARQLIKYPYPLDTRNNWESCCSFLQSMAHIRQLRVDIILRAMSYWMTDPGWDQTIVTVLSRLRSVAAAEFEVELNIEVPQQVWDIIGTVNFEVHKSVRPYNEEFEANRDYSSREQRR